MNITCSQDIRDTPFAHKESKNLQPASINYLCYRNCNTSALITNYCSIRKYQNKRQRSSYPFFFFFFSKASFCQCALSLSFHGPLVQIIATRTFSRSTQPDVISNYFSLFRLFPGLFTRKNYDSRLHFLGVAGLSFGEQVMQCTQKKKW